MTTETDWVENLMEKSGKLRLAHQGVMTHDTMENMKTHRAANNAGYENWFGAAFRKHWGDDVGDVNIDSPVNHYHPGPQNNQPTGLAKLIGPLLIGGGLFGGAWLLADALKKPEPTPVVQPSPAPVPPVDTDTDTIFQLKLAD